MDTFVQTDRFLSITTPLGPDALIVDSFTGHEELSRLFEFEVDLASQNEGIDPTELVGKHVTLHLRSPQGEPRDFDGYVSRFGAGGKDERGFRRYRATIVPWLWFLTKTSDCRIFQEKSYPDIIKEVFADFGVAEVDTSNIKGTHPTHEYTVQYNETDFNFVSRLMEAEGLFYFFRHEAGKHTLVLSDSKVAYKDAADSSVPVSSGGLTPRHISRLEQRFEFTSGKVAFTDYNFETPATKLLSQTDTLVPLSDAASYEVFEYPGAFAKKGDGGDKIKLRMEEEEVGYHLVEGDSDCTSFAPGLKFTVSEHEVSGEAGKSYALHSIRHSAVDTSSQLGVGGTQSYENSFLCFPADVVYRPALTTEKPLVGGLESAVVVGPAGEEIHTDQYGRIKVQFHWDRYGAADENSSCWMRVAQSVAGKNWGAFFLPRIGQEVIVSFLSGDPDRPLVTGGVYNAENMPPYDQPANKTQSGFKSRSTKGGGTDNFNELRFEDKKGSEEVYIHAEKDMNGVVENDQTLDVGANRTETIGKDRSLTVGANKSETIGSKKTIEVGDAHTETISGEMTLSVSKERSMTVGKDLKETVGGKHTVNVAKDQTSTIDGEMSVSVGKDMALDVAGTHAVQITKASTTSAKTITFEADDKIVLKTGKASIEMKKNGDITIKGKKLTVKGSGDVIIKGSKVAIN